MKEFFVVSRVQGEFQLSRKTLHHLQLLSHTHTHIHTHIQHSNLLFCTLSLSHHTHTRTHTHNTHYLSLSLPLSLCLSLSLFLKAVVCDMRKVREKVKWIVQKILNGNKILISGRSLITIFWEQEDDDDDDRVLRLKPLNLTANVVLLCDENLLLAKTEWGVVVVKYSKTPLNDTFLTHSLLSSCCSVVALAKFW